MVNRREKTCGRWSWLCLLLLLLAFLPAEGQAGILDLTTAGSSGWINDALFSTNDRSPTGTGVIDPFLRIQKNRSEQGYNTDVAKASDFRYDEKYGTWTHSLLLSDIRVIPINGKDYLEFLLDINQEKSKPMISLDRLMIFQESVGNLTVPVENLAGLGKLVYNLDVTGSTPVNNWIKLNYSLNPGSGWGDMYAYIPAANFTGAGPYVYLYSKFGEQKGYESNDETNAGFEEWAVDPDPATTHHAPVPGAVLLGVLGMGTAGWRLRRFA